MASIKKPNTICRNPNCTHGVDGGRKRFYACLTCLRSESWRAYCCSVNCYEEYTKIILDSRSKNKHEYPERTDMTDQEIQKVMDTPVETIKQYTETEELADYIQEQPGASLSTIIEKVNEDIDAANSKLTVENKFGSKKKKNRSVDAV